MRRMLAWLICCLVALAGSACASGARHVSSCSDLLTPAELAQAIGVSDRFTLVSPPVPPAPPSLPGVTIIRCPYSPNAVSVTYQVFASYMSGPGAATKAFFNEQRYAIQPNDREVSGLGDQAFLDNVTGEMWIMRGGAIVTITIDRLDPSSPEPAWLSGEGILTVERRIGEKILLRI